MSILYRAMLTDEIDSQKPALSGLDIRVPIDIRVDSEQNVHPKTGGLSTFSDPSKMPKMYKHESLGGLSRIPIFKIAEFRIH